MRPHECSRPIRNAEVIRGIRELAERTRLPITEAVGRAVRAQTRAAFDAHVRYGRSTPAALNLGDCFAYALA